jgi:ABC-type multidrug transport system fused ATPase/permease subunit
VARAALSDSDGGDELSAAAKGGAVNRWGPIGAIVSSVIEPIRASVALMLSPSHRRFAALTIFFGLTVVAFDMLTIIGLYPILVFVTEGKTALLSQIPQFAILEAGLAKMGLSVSLPFLCLFSSLMIVLRSLARYQQTALANRLSLSVILEKRDWFFERFIREPIAISALHNKNDRISFLVNDCNRVGDLARAGSEAVVDVVFIAVYFAALTMIYFDAVLMALLAGVIIFAALHRRTLLGRALGEQMSDQSLATYRRIDESLVNLKLIKLRGQESSIADLVRRSLRSLSDINDRLVAEKAKIENVSSAILHLAILAIFVTLVFRFEGNIASIGVFSVLAVRAIPHLSRLNSLRFEFAQSLQAFNRLGMVEAALAPAEVEGNPGTGASTPIGEIELDAVSFEYPSVAVPANPNTPGRIEARRHAVRNVSFAVGKGELIAIIGASGAGKSTLADLVASLIDPTAGSLRVDGTPLQSEKRRDYRRRLGIVSQHIAFFDLSVRENLLFGIEHAIPDDEIFEALRQAHCMGFIAQLPEGLDTRMGFAGAFFSGGQRQRLALARELLDQPDVLILDEPTSALDAESERAILASLIALKGRVTIIVIAHRLSTVSIGDRVLLMEDGRIVREFSQADVQQATEARSLLSV